MPLGRIRKIVRVAGSSNAPGQVPLADGGGGYGIISGDGGERIFFVDSAVVGVRFADLSQGEEVLYTLEDGPLMRADSVAPERRRVPRQLRPTVPPTRDA